MEGFGGTRFLNPAIFHESMEDTIITKLRDLLGRGIASEAEALYLLIEVRKLMDLRKTLPEQYELLKLYCDWVAHPTLYGLTAQKVVRRVDEVYPKLLDGTLDESERLDFRGLFNLDKFRRELADFLGRYDLPAFSDVSWNHFLGSFIGVIEDCPLRCKAENANLQNVDEVVLMPYVGGSLTDPNEEPPEINWALYHQGNLQFTMGNKSDLSKGTLDSILEFARRDRKS